MAVAHSTEWEKAAQTADLEELDPAREKKLVRKLDLYIIPPVMLLYLLSFLDRYDVLTSCNVQKTKTEKKVC